MLRASIAAASAGKARASKRGKSLASLDLGDLQDAVANLLRQHQLSVRRHAHQHLVELEVARGAHPDDAALAQQIDEILEQCAIEELRRIEAVQHVDALSGLLAILFQRLLRHRAAARPDQQGYREVVALDGLDRALR